MKIGIDARMYGPENGGLGRYIQQLITHLEKTDFQNEYVIFLRKNNWDKYNPASVHFQKQLADICWYGWKEQILLPKILNKFKVDLMHFPHWNIPVFYHKPFVVTIHDLIMHHYPRQRATTLDPIAYFIKDKLHRLVIRLAVTRAKHIFATSEFTKSDIINTFKIQANKITVGYQAPCLDARQDIDCDVKNKFGIHDKYVLYVGSAYPHKNVEGLLKAWNLFKNKYEENTQLVIVCKKDYFYNKLSEKFSVQNLPDVVFTDFVDDNLLSCLYKQASLFAFPSLYEGFGLPPLEAMKHNVPVVSSNRSCMPEILGEGAFYIDPENSEAFAEAIYKVLNDENLRQELCINGKKELERYSWNKLAKVVLSIYCNCKK
jgi:glycosyltransferase involved in cell wall biosynthesis